MALAHHGSLLSRDLRPIVGAESLHAEVEGNAAFGRGGLVRRWAMDEREAMMLDLAYPLHRPLSRLLIALERRYPFAIYVPERHAPKKPAPRAWEGDRHARFGGIILTAILTSIGLDVRGSLLRSHRQPPQGDHQEVDAALRTRGRARAQPAAGPGFNIRVVTIAQGAPARSELLALLRAYVREWPWTADAMRWAFEEMERVRPRRKAHLVNRGLWPYM